MNNNTNQINDNVKSVLCWHLFQAAAGQQQLWAGARRGGGGGEGAAQEQGGGRWLPGPGLPRPAGLRRLPETQNKVDTINIRIPHLLPWYFCVSAFWKHQSRDWGTQVDTKNMKMYPSISLGEYLTPAITSAV